MNIALDRRCFFLLLLLLSLVIAELYAIWPFTIDDMYITLRYAKHWSEGYGIVWNVGEAPIEGYSNFSFLLLARFALFLQLDPVLILKSAGILCFLGLLYAVFLLSKLWLRSDYALLVCFFVACYQGQIIWVSSGLETTLYELLIVLAIYCVLRSLRASNRSGISAGILLAFAGMTRPEAPAFFIMILALCFLYPTIQSRLVMRDLIYSWAMIYLPYFIWRWHYFGLFFPHTVYCKGMVEGGDFTLDKQYLTLIWPFFVLFLSACILILKKSAALHAANKQSNSLIYQTISHWVASARHTSQRHGKEFLFLVLPSIVYLVLCAHTEPLVAFENRFFLVSYVLCTPLVMVCLVFILQREVLIYPATLLFLLLFVPKMSVANYQYFTKNPVSGENLRKQVVEWLRSHEAPDSRVVLADCGYIPYYDDHPIIDSYCLNSRKMTTFSYANRTQQFCQWVLSKQPAFIIVTSWLHDGMLSQPPVDTCLQQALEKSVHYQVGAVLSASTIDRTQYRYTIYLRTETIYTAAN